MKIRLVGNELFRADGQTDMTELIITFRNFAIAPKQQWQICALGVHVLLSQYPSEKHTRIPLRQLHSATVAELMSIIAQQDATIYNFIIFSADSSTCFGWYPHPSSGAHSNSNYNIWHWSNRICYRPLTVEELEANTVRAVPDVVIRVWIFFDVCFFFMCCWPCIIVMISFGSNSCTTTFTLLTKSLYMFRAPTCPSSGGQTIHTPQLVQLHLLWRLYSW